jgi:hypothetical protein
MPQCTPTQHNNKIKKKRDSPQNLRKLAMGKTSVLGKLTFLKQ